MPWVYKQSTGELSHKDKKIAQEYVKKNNITIEYLVNEGSFPRGKYLIEAPETSKNTSLYILPLTAVGNTVLGRTSFQINGNSINNSGTAFSGRIIRPRSIRRKKNMKSGIKVLIFVIGLFLVGAVISEVFIRVTGVSIFWFILGIFSIYALFLAFTQKSSGGVDGGYGDGGGGYGDGGGDGGGG